jgi:vitamin K-dependent gamma-carboxylase
MPIYGLRFTPAPAPSKYYTSESLRFPYSPRWCLIFVKAELAIVYTFAGVCKINEDWLRGEPLRLWMSHRAGAPYLGWILEKESTAYFMSYGGLIYDLIAAPLLLWKRTLPIGLVLTAIFHISNKLIFNIGIFPWMMIASTTFFLPPDWPRRIWHKIFAPRGEAFAPIPTRTFAQTAPRSLTTKETVVVLLFVVFITHQVVVPLRLHLYPGIVAWNEYGHQFSWRMKLRTKKCDAVALTFEPHSKSAFRFPLERALNPRQLRKFASRPDMIIQMAHFLGDMLDANFEAAFPNVTTRHEIYIEVGEFRL